MHVKAGYFFTPPKRVTSPTWGPPPPCKQALKLFLSKKKKDALLLTAVHVNMKLVDNTLNNERLSLVNTKFFRQKLCEF